MRRRLARVRLAHFLRRSHLATGIVVVLGVLALRLAWEWRSGEWIVAASLITAWLLAGWIYSRLRLPRPGAALLLLDRRGGWKDCFSSAWEFLGSENPTESERLHLSRAAKLLPEAVRGMDRVLPSASLRAAWLAPLAALAVSLVPWGRVPPDFRDLALTNLMKAAAALQAGELQREAARIEGPDTLSEEEKEALERLRAEVGETAKSLADPGALTAGEMLESLESRARAAERLAEKLGTFDNAWASAEMLAEMARHPDTADLSVLIRDKSAAPAADEAGRLGGVLSDPGITGETVDRINRSLSGIAGAATDEDLVRPVGERFGNASRKLMDGQPPTAAREFEELAKHFRDLAARETAKRKLDDLARQLREAGGEISGSELKRMEEIARASDESLGASAGLAPLDAESPGASPQGTPGTLPAPGGDPKSGPQVPGLAMAPKEGGQEGPGPGAAEGQGEAGEGQTGEQKFSAPVPGEQAPEGQSGSALGMSDQSREGKGKGGMLSAPIPGMDPGQAAPGAGLSLGGGASSQSGQGGDQAGTGTAELVDSESAALKASGDAKVLARAGREGESTTRAVEGEARAEQAERSTREIIADFIAVEEQALDDQTLPLSRRQQVLRYFSAIRERFEASGAEPQDQ